MTFEEMEKSARHLHDNQIVQGYRPGRTEATLDRLEAMVERNALQIERNSQQIERNAQAIGKLANGFILLQAAMKGMIEGIDGLSATVERFVRSTEHDGHHSRGGDEPGGAH